MGNTMAWRASTKITDSQQSTSGNPVKSKDYRCSYVVLVQETNGIIGYFHFNKYDELLGDDAYFSLEDAKDVAKDEYDIDYDEWQECPIPDWK